MAAAARALLIFLVLLSLLPPRRRNGGAASTGGAGQRTASGLASGSSGAAAAWLLFLRLHVSSARSSLRRVMVWGRTGTVWCSILSFDPCYIPFLNANRQAKVTRCQASHRITLFELILQYSLQLIGHSNSVECQGVFC